MDLFVYNSTGEEKIPVHVVCAESRDFKQTETGWQTTWTSDYAKSLPNKVALKRIDTGELLALMSYSLVHDALAVEIVYIENAGHSNANYVGEKGQHKKYLDVARPLFAYAAKISFDAGFDGVIFLRAKTDKHIEYYCREFGAQMTMPHVDKYKLVIWEDAAMRIIQYYEGA